MSRHLAVTVVAAVALALSAASPALAAQPFPVNFHTFSFAAADSVRHGTTLSGSELTLGKSGLSGPYGYADPHANYNPGGVGASGDYSYGTRTSGVYNVPFPFDELVASWNADTPAGTWIEVAVKPRLDD